MIQPTPKPRRRLHIGDLSVSRDPVVLETLLGSCVSVCLFDPVAGIGGMNHIFLPGTPDQVRESRSTRFGINAMELLINGIMGLGGRRARLRAKVFGGAQILPSIPTAQSTGLRNLAFVERFLALESIPVLAQDVGGTATRILKFHTDTGTVLVRRIHPMELRAVLEAEADLHRQVKRAMQKDTDVTLFT